MHAEKQIVNDPIEKIFQFYSASSLFKPRVLVCAPSNAAIDEILNRIKANCLIDASGATYRPDMVRIGMNKTSSEFSLDRQVDGYCKLSKGLRFHLLLRISDQIDTKLSQIRNDITILSNRMQGFENVALKNHPECDFPNQFVVELVATIEQLKNAKVIMERLKIVKDADVKFYLALFFKLA